METLLDRLNAEIGAHRAYLERTLQECEVYLMQYDKATPEDVAAPTLDVEKWPGRVTMIREMRDVVRGQLGLDPGTLEGMCDRLAEAGGKKQRLIARARAIMQDALNDNRYWEEHARDWLAVTGPEGGDA